MHAHNAYYDLLRIYLQTAVGETCFMNSGSHSKPTFHVYIYYIYIVFKVNTHYLPPIILATFGTSFLLRFPRFSPSLPSLRGTSFPLTPIIIITLTTLVVTMPLSALPATTSFVLLSTPLSVVVFPTSFPISVSASAPIPTSLPTALSASFAAPISTTIPVPIPIPLPIPVSLTISVPIPVSVTVAIPTMIPILIPTRALPIAVSVGATIFVVVRVAASRLFNFFLFALTFLLWFAFFF